MTPLKQASARTTHGLSAHASSFVGAAALALLLVGCGGGGKKDKPASQVAAKVNKEEISVHQINYVLQQQRGIKPDQADIAGRQALERLVDQELAVQKAQELKIDREPKVVQQIEAARREIIARAYLERIGESASKPSAEAVSKYYAEKTPLFKERRIYNLQEVAIEAKPEQVDALRAKLTEAKTVSDFVAYLKANDFRFGSTQSVRPAEQLPLNLLDAFAKMKDGQAMLMPSSSGAQVIVLSSSRLEPVDEVVAKPAIEQFLLNDAKRKVVEVNLKGMRSAAKIEYVGKFAEASSSSAAAAAPTPVATTAAAVAASGGLNADAISKGMGIKK
jgi:EpsD family peptidyl-prolyl cis-trans isomerase